MSYEIVLVIWAQLNMIYKPKHSFENGYKIFEEIHVAKLKFVSDCDGYIQLWTGWMCLLRILNTIQKSGWLFTSKKSVANKSFQEKKKVKKKEYAYRDRFIYSEAVHSAYLQITYSWHQKNETMNSPIHEFLKCCKMTFEAFKMKK